ncbi:hypothetical protein A11A3_01737 [Alcanivorax hongdengensis A-11-3]|uniref:Chalcone isomerase domain-containing protein n=1 Tax=Alcanivorax hongdengensis A-11-3 TaxID=1177179 RepID=L0WFS0_9GAMM|nr:chalcone isomerase family protein [Alcanivorax hongdengensis]EKF75554.1 hypothetical protein A11A3_01737 [Alcanivorax hongdengensis A-11-3]
MVTRALTLFFTLMLIPAAHAWQSCHSADVKALKFFTVGKAQLLRQDCRSQDLLNAPVRLSFSYFRDVPGSAFAKAAEHFIELNTSDSQFQKLKARVEAFNSHYRDIGDGDTYTLTYDTDGSLVLALNGEPLAREKGDDFARAYLAIWFGDDPYSDSLKENLLGR